MLFLCFSLSQGKAFYNPRDEALTNSAPTFFEKHEPIEPLNLALQLKMVTKAEEHTKNNLSTCPTAQSNCQPF